MANEPSARTGFKAYALPVAAMVAIVASANVLVQYPFEHFGLESLLTWGALAYPVSFLVTDLTNRRYGPAHARRVVYVGFALAVVLSVALASPRIALASGLAFLAGQLLDVRVFNALRHNAWWRAPLVSSVLGAALDTALFFALAFAGTGLGEATFAGVLAVPLWVSWAFGDFLVKVLCGLAMLVPYAVLRARVPTLEQAAAPRA